MTNLVKSLEDLKVALEKENQALKEGNAEKNRIIEKLVKDHEDNEKVIEKLRELVEEEKQVSELRKQAKVKDEMPAKAVEEIEKVGTICK